MALDIVFLLVGLVLLFAGGEGLVRGAVALAARLGMSPLLIGLTVVGFGTSMPELVVSLKAAFAGSPDIAVGNVVGSNTANILLILGIAAVIYPIPTSIPGIRRDLFVMLAVAVLTLGLGYMGALDRLTGGLMFAALVGYIAYAALSGKQDADEGSQPTNMPLWQQLAFIVVGLAALVYGADLLVTGATSIARSFGIPEAVIGLTIVAVGTSLPELATSAVAAFRKHSEIAIGNVIGSNIFNILGILGITAVLHPVTIAPTMAAFDIPLMLGVTLMLVALLLAAKSLSRAIGASFMLLYVGYCAWLFTQTPAV
ncbi:calcium/sodium antiporter [Pannonibacter sp. SL95]|uniref:calcium/sodium antiporter n=1 Tax=Pannonibacter sp. SL95 TaxID=2995153 RepID=UPI00227651AE|nr:calcium/sodium antiporter [Pannonibacter sp. SL95]MCY1705657.1 calcium/sodium antiporter [Pannonibacter sp. SL95]